MVSNRISKEFSSQWKVLRHGQKSQNGINSKVGIAKRGVSAIALAILTLVCLASSPLLVSYLLCKKCCCYLKGNTPALERKVQEAAFNNSSLGKESQQPESQQPLYNNSEPKDSLLQNSLTYQSLTPTYRLEEIRGISQKTETEKVDKKIILSNYPNGYVFSKKEILNSVFSVFNSFLTRNDKIVLQEVCKKWNESVNKELSRKIASEYIPAIKIIVDQLKQLDDGKNQLGSVIKSLEEILNKKVTDVLFTSYVTDVLSKLKLLPQDIVKKVQENNSLEEDKFGIKLINLMQDLFNNFRLSDKLLVYNYFNSSLESTLLLGKEHWKIINFLNIQYKLVFLNLINAAVDLLLKNPQIRGESSSIVITRLLELGQYKKTFELIQKLYPNFKEDQIENLLLRSELKEKDYALMLYITADTPEFPCLRLFSESCQEILSFENVLEKQDWSSVFSLLRKYREKGYTTERLARMHATWQQKVLEIIDFKQLFSFLDDELLEGAHFDIQDIIIKKINKKQEEAIKDGKIEQFEQLIDELMQMDRLSKILECSVTFEIYRDCIRIEKALAKKNHSEAIKLYEEFKSERWGDKDWEAKKKRIVDSLSKLNIDELFQVYQADPVLIGFSLKDELRKKMEFLGEGFLLLQIINNSLKLISELKDFSVLKKDIETVLKALNLFDEHVDSRFHLDDSIIAGELVELRLIKLRVENLAPEDLAPIELKLNELKKVIEQKMGKVINENHWIIK